MFYKIKVRDHIRVPPALFDLPVNEAILDVVNKKYEGFISLDIGVAVTVTNITEIGEGIIIPGDGASYYDTAFELISFKPEQQELITGKIRDITDFGAFITMGPIDGMIHISQTMNDFVSFGKDKVLSGKESKKSLKVNDLCRARIIAVSFKDVSNPKLGLTMRQPYLGRLDWVEEEVKKSKGSSSPKKKEKEAKK
ncbi:DNA-directed RNA polymerase [Candidatus Woesearchaeota archaeon]|nr:DNA-directed RNA polymerase [Candidatus Woesearchaeota archaeon]|tara:strand:- start:9114 stop:9701 length:588 start_codon:yes stop_codon:yes gene_type:complete